MSRRWVGAVGWCALVLGILPIAAARAQEKPGGGARCVPAEKLAVYLEFDGLDAHAEGWHKTAMYKVLNETSAGAIRRSKTACAWSNRLAVPALAACSTDSRIDPSATSSNALTRSPT